MYDTFPHYYKDRFLLDIPINKRQIKEKNTTCVFNQSFTKERKIQIEGSKTQRKLHFYA